MFKTRTLFDFCSVVFNSNIKFKWIFSEKTSTKADDLYFSIDIEARKLGTRYLH